MENNKMLTSTAYVCLCLNLFYVTDHYNTRLFTHYNFKIARLQCGFNGWASVFLQCMVWEDTLLLISVGVFFLIIITLCISLLLVHKRLLHIQALVSKSAAILDRDIVKASLNWCNFSGRLKLVWWSGYRLTKAEKEIKYLKMVWEFHVSSWSSSWWT